MSSDKIFMRCAEAPPSFAHLRRLTDDTGLLEHALGRVPRRKEGYTTDDNARALWTVTEWLTLASELENKELCGMLSEMADVYMAFLLWSQQEDGWWHNNFAYDRIPEPEERSHDCQGRAFWACADAWVRLDGPLRETARILIERSLHTLARIDSLRGRAFAMAACAHLLEADVKGLLRLPADWQHVLSQQMKRLEDLMNDAFHHFTGGSWRWFEPAMTYGNGVLAWALLRTYRVTRRPETLRNGLDSLASLLDTMTAEEGWLRPIGNDGWCTNEAISRWDQQPLELFKLALALEEAALAVESARSCDDPRLVASGAAAMSATGGLAGTDAAGGLAGADAARGGSSHTGKSRLNPAAMSRSSSMTSSRQLREMRDLCLDWFYGQNDLQVPIIDPADGSCCDGLAEHGPNLNCGAEAVISYLMTEALCKRASS